MTLCHDQLRVFVCITGVNNSPITTVPGRVKMQGCGTGKAIEDKGRLAEMLDDKKIILSFLQLLGKRLRGHTNVVKSRDRIPSERTPSWPGARCTKPS